MARPLRIEFDGALYHVTARGDRREAIYEDDADRERFLETLGAVVDVFNWRCHAYCLMTNHYHLVVETPDGNLAKGMRQLNGVYTQASNRRHGRVGHLFQGRYKAVLVDGDSHLLELARYVVLNPVRARIVKSAGDWRWSSYRATVGAIESPAWLEVDGMLAACGSRRAAAVDAYERFVAAGVGAETIWSRLNRQVYLGDDAFVARMQAKATVGRDEVQIQAKKGTEAINRRNFPTIPRKTCRWHRFDSPPTITPCRRSMGSRLVLTNHPGTRPTRSTRHHHRRLHLLKSRIRFVQPGTLSAVGARHQHIPTHGGHPRRVSPRDPPLQCAMPAAPPSLLDAFKPLAGRALEAALNRLLALDGDSRDAVAALEGRRIQLAVEAPALALEIKVREGRLAVGPADPAHEPDLAVRGSLGGLLAQLPLLRPASAQAGKVRIAGDAELARQVQKLAERFDPDWNLPFTQVFGEVIGVQIAGAVRAAFRHGRDGAARLARDAADYLTEESRDLVGRAELDAHHDDVDALRDRVERLQARIQQLQRRQDDKTTAGAPPACNEPPT